MRGVRKEVVPLEESEHERYLELVPVARKTAFAFARRLRLDAEDVASESMAILVGVMREFDPAKNDDIKGFVGSRVRLRLLDWLRLGRVRDGMTREECRASKRKQFRGRTLSASAIESTPLALEQQADPNAEAPEAASIIEKLRAMFKARWPVVEFLLGWITCKEAGRRLGVSESRASQIGLDIRQQMLKTEWLREEAGLWADE